MTTVKFLCIAEIKIPNDKLLDGAAERAAQATLEAPREFSWSVDVQGALLTRVRGGDFQDEKLYFLPNKAGAYTFYILPGFGVPRESTIDYTLKIAAKSLDDKLRLNEKVTFGWWNGPSTFLNTRSSEPSNTSSATRDSTWPTRSGKPVWRAGKKGYVGCSVACSECERGAPWPSARSTTATPTSTPSP
jgi:hypothetical protein